MSDVVIVVLALAIVIVLAALAMGLYNRRISGADNRFPTAWKLEERSETDTDGNRVLAVYCVHPDQEDLFVGSARWASPDFENAIEEVRVEGQIKLDALNRPFLQRRAVR